VPTIKGWHILCSVQLAKSRQLNTDGSASELPFEAAKVFLSLSTEASGSRN